MTKLVTNQLADIVGAKTLRRLGLRKTGSYTRCGSKAEKRIASKAVRRANKEAIRGAIHEEFATGCNSAPGSRKPPILPR